MNSSSVSKFIFILIVSEWTIREIYIKINLILIKIFLIIKISIILYCNKNRFAIFLPIRIICDYALLN
jgi:hypothetical protein